MHTKSRVARKPAVALHQKTSKAVLVRTLARPQTITMEAIRPSVAKRVGFSHFGLGLKTRKLINPRNTKSRQPRTPNVAPYQKNSKTVSLK